MIGRIRSVLQDHGPRGLFIAMGHRFLVRKARCARICTDLLAGRTGLEIGGPSEVFSREGLLPLYPVVDRLDNCNFASTTLWEGRIREGLTFEFDPGKPPGRQYIAEAADLAPVPTAAYDFVLSSHTLEHTANPIRALHEWMRVLRTDGLLVLVVPHKEGTFDRQRPVTLLKHLIADWTNETTEADLTHLPEILALHDLARDPAAGDRDTFAARCQDNPENRCLHHHAFDTSLVVEMIEYVGMQILAVEPRWPFHIIMVARKLPAGEQARNQVFRRAAAAHYRNSPFKGDRTRKSVA